MSAPRAYDLTQMLQKSEAFCAYQERCSHEVIEKLKRMGAEDGEILQVLSSLLDNKFLDDTRFAKAYAVGKLRIKHYIIKCFLLRAELSIDRKSTGDV